MNLNDLALCSKGELEHPLYLFPDSDRIILTKSKCKKFFEYSLCDDPSSIHVDDCDLFAIFGLVHRFSEVLKLGGTKEYLLTNLIGKYCYDLVTFMDSDPMNHPVHSSLYNDLLKKNIDEKYVIEMIVEHVEEFFKDYFMNKICFSMFIKVLINIDWKNHVITKNTGLILNELKGFWAFLLIQEMDWTKRNLKDINLIKDSMGECPELMNYIMELNRLEVIKNIMKKSTCNIDVPPLDNQMNIDVAKTNALACNFESFLYCFNHEDSDLFSEDFWKQVSRNSIEHSDDRVFRFLLHNTEMIHKYVPDSPHICCHSNLSDRLSHLIRYGVSIRIFDSTNNLPIHVACYEQRSDLVFLLVEHGSPLNVENSEHKIPLFISAELGDYKSFVILFNTCVGLSHHNEHDLNVYHYASMCDDDLILKHIFSTCSLDHDKYINKKSKDNLIPLCYSLMKGNSSLLN